MFKIKKPSQPDGLKSKKFQNLLFKLIFKTLLR